MKRALQVLGGTVASMGIYGDSQEFKAAKEAFDADPLNRELRDGVIDAAGGKHSGTFTAEEEDAAADVPPKVELRDGVVWATVPGVGRHSDGQEYADTLAKGITSHQNACAAVVDLRGNDGGDMGPMIAGLSPLLPDGTVLSFVSRFTTTPVTVDGNSVSGGGTPIQTTGGKLDVPVAVLIDSDTGSSGEATLLAFRGLDKARTFGTPTAGYASANMVYDYPDGRSLMLTIAKDKARTGEEFSEDPIAPDAPISELDSWLDSWLGKRCS